MSVGKFSDQLNALAYASVDPANDLDTIYDDSATELKYIAAVERIKRSLGSVDVSWMTTLAVSSIVAADDKFLIWDASATSFKVITGSELLNKTFAGVSIAGLGTLANLTAIDTAADQVLIWDNSALVWKVIPAGTLSSGERQGTDTNNTVKNSHLNSADTSTICATIAGGGLSSVTSSHDAAKTTLNIIGDATYSGESGYTAGDADYATISGGYDHLNNQLAGTISGGGHNKLSEAGTHGTIAGGAGNYVKAATDYAVIGGGSSNQIGSTGPADNATIAGGADNTITQGLQNTVGGGNSNDITSSGDYNTIAGGGGHAISGSGSSGTIGGGNANTVSGTGGTVSGGQSNTASGANSAVAGGDNNTASGQNTVISGSSSTVSAAYAQVHGHNVAGVVEGSQNFSAIHFGSVDGSCQSVSFTIACRTVGLGAAYMNSRGDAQSVSAIYPSPPENSTWVGTIHVEAHEVTTTKVSAWQWTFAVRRSTGTITVDYQPTAGTRYLDQASAPDFIGIGTTDTNLPRLVSASFNQFIIQVTGVTGKTIDWVARVDCLQHLMT